MEDVTYLNKTSQKQKTTNLLTLAFVLGYL